MKSSHSLLKMSAALVFCFLGFALFIALGPTMSRALDHPSPFHILRGALEVKELAGFWRDDARGEIAGLDQLLGRQWFPALRKEGQAYVDPFSGAPASLAQVEDENGVPRLALVFKGVGKKDCKRIARAYAEVAWQEMYHDNLESGEAISPKVRLGFGGLLGLAGTGGMWLRVDGREWLSPLSHWISPGWDSPALRGWEGRAGGGAYWFDGIKITSSLSETGSVHMSRSQLKRTLYSDAYSYGDVLPRLCENAPGPTLDIVFVGL